MLMKMKAGDAKLDLYIVGSNQKKSPNRVRDLRICHAPGSVVVTVEPG